MQVQTIPSLYLSIQLQVQPQHQVASYDGYLHYPEYNLLAHEERLKACPSMEYHTSQLYCLTL
jgi:flagellar basal body rod protein FlgC